MKKKIAFIISGKSPITSPGGLGAYSYNVAKIFSKMRYQVFIIGFSNKNETIDLGFATLIHFTNRLEKLFALGAIIIGNKFVHYMKSIIDKKNPEEVIVYSAGIWGIAGVKLKKIYKNLNLKITSLVGYFTTHKHEYRGHVIGTVVRDYGIGTYLFMKALYFFAVFFYSPIEKKMLNETDKIVVHYESTKKILIKEFKNLDINKIKKIPYFIDIYSRKSDNKFKNIKSAVNKKINVSVICRQDPRKSINTFLKAVKILFDKNYDFNCFIAGSGVFLKNNIKLSKKLKIYDKVKFLGFVESVEDVLNYTDIYVLPSVEEGSGAISLLEAMHKGVAIVTTLCDGIPENFINNKTALLVKMQDYNKMAEAIELLLTNSKKRKEIATNVKKDYIKRFSFDKMKKGIEDIIFEM